MIEDILREALEAVVSQQLISTADGRSRVAAFEVLHVNHAAKSLIRDGGFYQLPDVMQMNHKPGMITMDEAVSRLYHDGKISRDMAIQYAQDIDGMELRLQ